MIAVPSSTNEVNEPRIPRRLPQRTLQRILVPVDFSATTEPLVRHAWALATQSDASVDLVHVLTSPSFAPSWQRRDEAPETVEQAHRALATLADRDEASSISVRTRVLSGDPAPTITQYAEEQQTDLILMGTHGRTGLKRMVLGSVAEAVMQTAPCPVGTLKSDGHSLLRKDARPPPPQRPLSVQETVSSFCRRVKLTVK